MRTESPLSDPNDFSKSIFEVHNYLRARYPDRTMRLQLLIGEPGAEDEVESVKIFIGEYEYSGHAEGYRLWVEFTDGELEHLELDEPDLLGRVADIVGGRPGGP